MRFRRWWARPSASVPSGRTPDLPWADRKQADRSAPRATSQRRGEQYSSAEILSTQNSTTLRPNPDDLGSRHSPPLVDLRPNPDSGLPAHPFLFSDSIRRHLSVALPQASTLHPFEGSPSHAIRRSGSNPRRDGHPPRTEGGEPLPMPGLPQRRRRRARARR